MTPTAVKHNITSDQPKRARHRMAAADHAALYPCVDEADALRDEEEAHAGKLRSAGVPVTTVRYNGTIHDFMLLDALSETRATRAAIDQATAFLRAGLGTG